ncbi:hypothetical protein ACEPAI_4021 [Sanghuangporus weigelae]
MSDATEPAPAFCVQDPFTANDYSDIILRSSDGFRFYAIKGLLSMTSPIFRDMFSLPQGTMPAGGSEERNLPVVDIAESGIVTDALLRYICPVDDPVLTIELAFDILLAAQKYEMRRTLSWAKGAIRMICPSADESIVLQSYALASKQHLEDEIRIIARESLKWNLMGSPFIHLLHSSFGRTVLSLSLYHHEVGKRIIIELFSDSSELSADAADIIHCTAEGCHADHNCKIRFSEKRVSVPEWWSRICQDMANRLFLEGTILEDRIFEESLGKRVHSSGCDECKCRLKKRSNKLVKILKREIGNLVSQVEFEIPWKDDH